LGFLGRGRAGSRTASASATAVRQDKPELAAATQFALQLEPASKRPRGPLGNREAEPGAAARAIARLSYAVEAIEHASLVLRCDTDACVANGDYNLVATPTHPQIDASTGRRIADRVREQVVQDHPE
jgi:hypothetical protein